MHRLAAHDALMPAWDRMKRGGAEPTGSHFLGIVFFGNGTVPTMDMVRHIDALGTQSEEGLFLDIWEVTLGLYRVHNCFVHCVVAVPATTIRVKVTTASNADNKLKKVIVFRLVALTVKIVHVMNTLGNVSKIEISFRSGANAFTKEFKSFRAMTI